LVRPVCLARRSRRLCGEFRGWTLESHAGGVRGIPPLRTERARMGHPALSILSLLSSRIGNKSNETPKLIDSEHLMTYENILLEKKNSIAYVTVNRPKVLNALNMATMEELRAAFHDIKNDAAIRVVIFTGAGEKAFIAGADIGELARQDAVTGKEYTHRGQNVLNLIENLGKPVIACINGFALGGGCEIAMACTMRLASENAKLGQPEVKLGIIPGYGGTQRLPRLVGKGIAMQMVLAGEMISAQEAHRMGLVNEVTVAAELIPRAEAIAWKIIANAPLAVQYAMEAVNKGMEMTLSEGLYLEAVLFGVACATEDKKEGTAAFLEKRAAQFKGK